MTGAEQLLFWTVGPLSVFGALILLVARKAVHAAMGMVLTMVGLGILYIGQGAEFPGVVQIFVYSGAVMMLFLFVVMLVGVDSNDTGVETLAGQRWAAWLFGIGLGAVLSLGVGRATYRSIAPEELAGDETMQMLARAIFGPNVWVFEVLSALLVTAALGAMVLAHREPLIQRPTQADWARRRIRQGEHIAGKPAPGVYARHNAADTPALEPDGSPSALSVPRALVAREQVESAVPFIEAQEDRMREIEEGSRP